MSVAIYNLESDSWRAGTELDIALAASVEFEDSFLLIGGFEDGPVEMNTIYQYDATNDFWILRPERLELARDTALAILVDDTVATCS